MCAALQRGGEAGGLPAAEAAGTEQVKCAALQRSGEGKKHWESSNLDSGCYIMDKNIND